MDRRWIIPFLLAIAATITYANALQVPFILDDFENVRFNPHIRIDTLTIDCLVDAGFNGPSHQRPVANISFALNYLLGGYNFAGYHLVNGIIHWLCGLFLYLLFKLTLDLSSSKSVSNRLVAFLAALVWLVHPLQTQAVTYIVQRMTSLSALFYVMSLYFYAFGRYLQDSIKNEHVPVHRRSPKRYFLASFCMGVLALGTKEVAATLPFFIFLYEWFFFQNLKIDWIRQHKRYLIVAVAGLGLVSLHYLQFDPMDAILEGYKRRDFTMAQRLFTEPRVVLFYLSLIVFPHPSRLNLDHDFTVSQSLVDPISTLVAVMCIVGLFAIALFTARRQRLLSFSILWFLGNLVIESSLIGLEILFEHRNYLPSMFVILLFVVSGFRMIQNKRVVVGLFSIVAIVFSFWTMQRNVVWQSEASLWEDCANKSPNKARPHYNLALALAEQGQSINAIDHYRRALLIEPNSASINTNLAIELFESGEHHLSMDHFDKALNIEPNFFHAHLNKGKSLYKIGRLDEANFHISKALSIKPDSAQLNNTLGLMKLDAKELKAAGLYFVEAIKIDPEFDEAYNNLGVAMMLNNHFDQARKLFSKAIELNPTNQDVRLNLKAVNQVIFQRKKDPLAIGYSE